MSAARTLRGESDMTKWHRRLLVAAAAATLGTTFELASAQDAALEATPVADPQTIAASALPARLDAPNPTAEHVAFMASLDAIGEATARANALESAQRVTTGVDLWFGISPEGAR